jgi:hypothetical protein
MKSRAVVIFTCFMILLNANLSGQDLYKDIDYLEIHFKYTHSLLKDGYKHIIVTRSQDSCYFEIRNKAPASDSAWFMVKPNRVGSISCGAFDEIVNSFNDIDNREVMYHNKGVVIMDGYGFSLTLTNQNSRVDYSLHSPRRTDEGIENFKNTVELMLKLDNTTWKKLLK